MRAARSIWRFLNHPVLSAAGNVSLLITAGPLAVAVLVAIAGRIFDQPILFLVAIGLALIGLLFVTYSVWQRRSPKQKGLGPEERRKQLDDLYHPAADPRRELGEDCASMAMRIRVFDELNTEARPVVLDRMTREIREANPDLDPEQARAKVEKNANFRLVMAYRSNLRDEALKLFDAAREQGAIAAKGRLTVERPEATDLKDLASMFRAIARRLGLDVPEPDPETRLQKWARERLAAANEIERECRVQSDGSYYFKAMKKWDLENLEQLCEVREDLLPSYRENSQTGEEEPGPRVTEEDGRRSVAPGEWRRYYDARIEWLRKTLSDFQGAIAA